MFKLDSTLYTSVDEQKKLLEEETRFLVFCNFAKVDYLHMLIQ